MLSVSELLNVDGCNDESFSNLQDMVRKMNAKDIVPAKRTTYHIISKISG